MKSRTGLFAVVTLVLAVPVSAVSEAVWLGSQAVTIHLALMLGAFLISRAVADFDAPPVFTLAAAVSTGLLSSVFMLQAISETWPSSGTLHTLAFDLLGQGLEFVLMVPFVAWMAAVVGTDSEGKTRAFGAIAAGVFGGAVLYIGGGNALGVETSEMAKLLFFLPLTWLLLESTKRRALGTLQRGPLISAM